MRRLLDVLREDLGLTGTKEGCGEGECGACSVLLDGEVVDCVPRPRLPGRRRATSGRSRAWLAGRPTDAALDALQQAFLETGGAQCGICTPGMLMAARAYLDAGGGPDEDAIREAIAGNLCRCTGYTKIIEAIALAADARPARVPRLMPPVVEPPLDVAAHARRGLRAARGNGRDVAAAPLAGGTDLHGPDHRRARRRRRRACSTCGGSTSCAASPLEAGSLVLGALTTYTDIRRSAICREHVPALAEAAATIGAAQIQNRGTLGGNAANASPAGDTLPVLLATDAELVAGLARGASARSRPRRLLARVPHRPRWRPTSWSLRIRIPLPARPRRPVPQGRHAAGTGDQQGRAGARVARGRPAALARRPGRARLRGGDADPGCRHRGRPRGRRPTPETADRAAETLAAELQPIDDVRSTAEYRRTVAARVLHRLIRDAGGW